MRSIPLQIAHLLLPQRSNLPIPTFLLFVVSFLFSLSACNNNVEFLENPHTYTPLTLENRVVYVSANIKSEPWEIDDSNTVTVHFIPQKFGLIKLDSSLSRIANEPELQGTFLGDTCFFANSDYNTPYIELTLSGLWIIDFVKKTSPYSQSITSDTAEGILTRYADIGKDTVCIFNWESIQTAQNIMQYVRDEGYPFTVAKQMAENNMTKGRASNYQGESSIIIAEAIAHGYNPAEILNFLSNFLDSSRAFNFQDSTIEIARTTTELIDSIVLKHGFNCNRFGILCGVYNLEPCSKDHYLDTITNEFSIFKSNILVCNNNVWSIIDSRSDSLGVCTSYNPGDTIMTDSVNYSVCTGEEWATVDRTNLKFIFGTCKKNETEVVLFAGKYYFCAEEKWYDATKIDYEIGVCGRDIPYETAFLYNDTIALCRFSESAYSETANEITLTHDKQYSGHTWHWANETEAYLYRTGGNCDKNIDSMQIIDYNGITYGCINTPQGFYGWRDLKASDVVTTDVDKTDSTEQTIYEIQHGDFIFIQSSIDDTTLASLIGIYDISSHHRYSIITTKDRQWIDTPLPSKCPEGFHLPNQNEISAFAGEVKNGNVPDMQYDPEKPFFRTSHIILENAGLCVAIPTNGSIVDAQTFACKLDAIIPVACTREFVQ